MSWAMGLMATCVHDNVTQATDLTTILRRRLQRLERRHGMRAARVRGHRRNVRCRLSVVSGLPAPLLMILAGWLRLPHAGAARPHAL